MKLNYIKYSLFAAVLLVSCKNGQTKANEEANNQTAQGKNPETGSRHTDIPPAFPGQTRVAGVSTQTAYDVQVINSNLGKPWSVINLPDGRFFVTDKTGHGNIVSQDGSSLKKVTGFPEVDAKGQGGLLDIILDPDFASNRMMYWAFSEKVSGGNHTAVAKGKLSADETKIENPTVIFRATPTYDGDKHYGSRLVFDKDGHLFVTTGERSDKETRHLAQDNSTYLGKTLKITKDGKPAPGNPKVAGWKPEIYSTGHRSPQGLALHPETGVLWQSEMGPRGGDEINLIKPGIDYGWPTITYGEEYSGMTIGAGIGQKQGMEQPVYFWDPSPSPSGIDFYTGSITEWKNNLMVGCLSGEKIIRLVIEGDRVVGEEWLLTDKKERIRDVLNGMDGNLYAVSDSGKLFKISKK